MAEETDREPVLRLKAEGMNHSIWVPQASRSAKWPVANCWRTVVQVRVEVSSATTTARLVGTIWPSAGETPATGSGLKVTVAAAAGTGRPPNIRAPIIASRQTTPTPRIAFPSVSFAVLCSVGAFYTREPPLSRHVQVPS